MSPPGRPNTLRLRPSKLNLTALNGNYAGPQGQTFVGRRQQDTLFTFSVDLDFAPDAGSPEAEAGVSAFLTQNHHLDLGVVMLPVARSTGAFPGSELDLATRDAAELIPQFRFRGLSYVPVPADVVVPVPTSWLGAPLRLEIRASNVSHFAFSAGPAHAMSQMRTLLEVSNEAVSWGFTGEIYLSYPIFH